MKKTLTLFDKLWHSHIVKEDDTGLSLIYIDRHIVHEVTSPQAFEGLKINNKKIWRTESIIAVPDHNVTTKLDKYFDDPISKIQIDTLTKNCQDFNINKFIPLNDIRQGIVHIISPEQGYSLPGMSIVCGDSHTSTHGALGTLAFGIGTSEVEHVLTTQCLWQKKLKTMRINISGKRNDYIEAKDIALYIISQIGTAGATGYAVEFSGNVISDMSIEQRMTLCNMAIEAGARVGLVAVDEKTIDYVSNKENSPKGEQLEKAKKYWQTLKSDINATFNKEISIDITNITPQVTWGTSPEMVIGINETIPNPEESKNVHKEKNIKDALSYMGLRANDKLEKIHIDKVFIGSCTNGRIEDLRSAASMIKNKKIAKNIKLALVVPGSGLVKKQAEEEGLDKIFTNAGFEWRKTWLFNVYSYEC